MCDININMVSFYCNKSRTPMVVLTYYSFDENYLIYTEALAYYLVCVCAPFG